MEAVILIGIQGSGKSTFYRERFFDTHVRISLDLLRTRHREALLLRACLEGKQRFVVDKMSTRDRIPRDREVIQRLTCHADGRISRHVILPPRGYPAESFRGVNEGRKRGGRGRT